jgi:hypothetical protein
VGLLYASHVIEYFDRDEIVPILRGWKTKLAPGGILRLAVPDFAVIVGLYSDGVDLERFLGPLYGKMQMGGETIYHRTAYDEPGLRGVLQAAGFVTIRWWNWRYTSHAHFDDFSQAHIPHMDKENGVPISLNLEAINE